MSEVVFVFIMLLVFFLIYQWQRSRFLEARSKSQKLRAVVIEYRRERDKIRRSSLKKIDYPYVRIQGDESNELVCLFYARAGTRLLKIGEEVDVFWHDKKLVRWNQHN